MYLSVCLPAVCLSTCKLENAAILRDLNFWTRLNNVKNETILRDFFIFRTWQRQKQSNSARLPSKMESWVQSWWPRTNAFCDVSSPSRSYEVLHLMLQNATPLRKSAPWPPNISDEHVSCTAPAMRNIFANPLHISHARHRFWKCHKTLTFFLTFGRVENPLRLPRKTTSERPKLLQTRQFFTLLVVWLRNVLRTTTACTFFDISTSKSALNLSVFYTFDFAMCFAPQCRALFRHVDFQKRSDTDLLCTFWLGNVLRATTPCTLSTSQLPKVVRTWCALYILTWKRASRHNGSVEKHSVSRLSYLFAHLDLLSSETFSFLIFFLLLFSSLTFPISAFHLSILSEVWLLNFLR